MKCCARSWGSWELLRKRSLTINIDAGRLIPVASLLLQRTALSLSLGRIPLLCIPSRSFRAHADAKRLMCELPRLVSLV